jgi:RNA polymerase sigma-70 factor, ECF subfamily
VSQQRLSRVELLRDPDADLIAACLQPQSEGFDAAFEQLFHRYHERAYSIAFRVTGSRADALDVVQESFALVFRTLFSTWLFRIVVNCSIDLRRRSRSAMRPRLLGDDLLEDEVVDEQLGPRDLAVQEELGCQVQEAISQLSPKLRVVLALRYLEGMSYEDLAATLELSLGTVKSRLARAHLALEHVVRTRFPHLSLDDAPGTSGGSGGAASDSVGGVG